MLRSLGLNINVQMVITSRDRVVYFKRMNCLTDKKRTGEFA